MQTDRSKKQYDTTNYIAVESPNEMFSITALVDRVYLEKEDRYDLKYSHPSLSIKDPTNCIDEFWNNDDYLEKLYILLATKRGLISSQDLNFNYDYGFLLTEQKIVDLFNCQEKRQLLIDVFNSAIDLGLFPKALLEDVETIIQSQNSTSNIWHHLCDDCKQHLSTLRESKNFK